MRHPKYLSNQYGVTIVLVLIIAMLLSSMGIALAEISISDLGLERNEQLSLTSLNIAEAGINYYLWHLAHNPNDDQDGTGAPATPPYGPYIHTYTDVHGNTLGTFTLWITPPVTGSTITTVKSIGQATGFLGTRTIVAQLGIPSFANYALLSNTELWFGPTESSNGTVFSNIGVHFDGTNNGDVESANATYTPSTEYGGTGYTVEPGVWGNGGPTSQWIYPVPSVNFNQVTANLSTLQSEATSGGTVLPATSKLGYYLLLNSDGTISVYTVSSESGSGITTTYVGKDAYPANGIFFVNGNVWIQGTNYPKRLTVVSAILPEVSSTETSIKIIGNLTYAATNGSDAIGLIAQNNIDVTSYAPTNITIDGALLAQNGSVWYPYSGGILKNSLTFYGAIATNSTWTWNWVTCDTCAISDGYATTNTTFDSHLTFGPPPSYPTTGAYSVMGWQELPFGE